MNEQTYSNKTSKPEFNLKGKSDDYEYLIIKLKDIMDTIAKLNNKFVQKIFILGKK